MADDPNDQQGDDQNDGGDLSQEDMDDLGDLGDDDQDNGDQQGDDEKDWKPPTKGQWDRLQRRMAKLTQQGRPPAKRTGKTVDQQMLDQLGKTRKTSSGKGSQQDDDSDDGDDQSAEVSRWKGIAVQQAAATALSAAGFSGNAAQAVRLTRMIDLDDVEPDRNGKFDLEDEIEELKEEFPELFRTRNGSRLDGDGRRRTPQVRRNQQQGPPMLDPTQQTSRQMLKQAGFK